MAKRSAPRAADVRRADNRARIIFIVAVVAVVLVGLVYLLVISLRPPQPIAGLITYPPPAADHSLTVEYPYEALPPHGGIHRPEWQNCGVYREPIRPEHAVHSLEHGVVWITYRENLSADQVQRLEQIAWGQSHLLVSPYPNQDSPIVLTAWIYQLEVPDASDQRIQAFIERYVRDATAPEPGASCAGQIGNPVDR